MVAVRRGKRSAVLTYRYSPGYATRVTFLKSSRTVVASPSGDADIFATHLSIIRAPSEVTACHENSIRLGVVMDPIEDIKYAKDSTLAMLLAAQARGFELVYMEQNDLVAARRTRLRPDASADRQGRSGGVVHPRRAESRAAQGRWWTSS